MCRRSPFLEIPKSPLHHPPQWKQCRANIVPGLWAALQGEKWWWTAFLSGTSQVVLFWAWARSTDAFLGTSVEPNFTEAASKLMNWEVHLSSFCSLAFIWALYQSETQECGVPAAAAGLCSPSEKSRVSQTQRQTGHQDAKKYCSRSIQPEPSSTAVAWSRRSRADRRIEVNLKIFFSVYFLIYLLLLDKWYSNSGIFDHSFTAQLNYWHL